MKIYRLHSRDPIYLFFEFNGQWYAQYDRHNNYQWRIFAVDLDDGDFSEVNAEEVNAERKQHIEDFVTMKVLGL